MSANPTKAEVIAFVTARLEKYLDDFQALEIPGSIVISVHRDSHAVRKIEVQPTESWPLSKPRL